MTRPMHWSGTCRSPSRSAGPSAMRTGAVFTGAGISHPRGIGFRQAGIFARPAFERVERACLVDVDDRVELIGEPRAEIVARPLSVRLVDHTDRPLETRRLQQRLHCSVLAWQDEKSRDIHVVKQPFVAPLE